MARGKRKVEKWKQKEWYTIEAPGIFEEKEVRETPATSKEELIGRTLNVPLRDITGKRSHKNTEVTFQIEDIEGEKAKTYVKKFKLTRDYIRKNIRKRTSVIKLVRDLEIKDSTIHVTAYAFTVNKIHTSKQKKIREVMDKKLKEEVENNDFDSLLQKMLFGKTATNIFKEAKAIAPIKRIDITKCEVKRGK